VIGDGRHLALEPGDKGVGTMPPSRPGPASVDVDLPVLHPAIEPAPKEITDEGVFWPRRESIGMHP
jgi:hypothetical protein